MHRQPFGGRPVDFFFRLAQAPPLSHSLRKSMAPLLLLFSARVEGNKFIVENTSHASPGVSSPENCVGQLAENQAVADCYC